MKTICLYISLFLLLFSSLQCLTDTEKKIGEDTTASAPIVNEKKKNEIHESFRKIGWIKEDRFRTIVFIITPDECRNSSKQDIEAKLKVAAYTSLSKELNPTTNVNTSAQIKKMIDSFGEMIQVDKDCNSENIFFYDIVKKDLKLEFEKVKHTK